MKKILSLVLVSVLGGIFTLGAYKLFIEKENNPEIQQSQLYKPVSFPVSKL